MNDHARHPLRFFVDFDGTIVREDVGDEFFRRFAGARALSDALECVQMGNLTMPDAYRLLAAALPSLNSKDLDAFCVDFAIDSTFIDFLRWTEAEGHPLLVLSDGFDFYIHRLFARAGITPRVSCNLFALGKDGRAALRFPHFDAAFPGTANCKSTHILAGSEDGDTIVFAGDGTSDFDAARCADLVFARGALESFCQRENISFRSYRDFREVRETVERLVATRTLRRPTQAALHRRAAWLGG
jgi:2-hydroxy-3-keto-5-methylthiopentenyl-1-phosphate phosphatase